jgi:hypothetical protein
VTDDMVAFGGEADITGRLGPAGSVAIDPLRTSVREFAEHRQAR